MPWFLILLSIMGTQASAITFLSAPGQAYTDGMRFVQYYFGLPLAMIVLCITFVPIYHKLKVYTAYEYLEQRFDVKTRVFASVLFLISRGLSTGISIYAPSIILSTLLGWNIYLTNIAMGGLLIIYTVSGGAKAVAYTQMQQLFIVFLGMFLAGYTVIHLLPDLIGFKQAIKIGAHMGKMNVLDTTLEPQNQSWWKEKYNIWSGLIGGFFLALSYFGTDQSQVGRYLTASTIKESRIGLLMNGLVKVPMQFFILLIGVFVFVFYINYSAPINFNQKLIEKTLASPYRDSFLAVQHSFDNLSLEKQQKVQSLAVAIDKQNRNEENELAGELNQLQLQSEVLRNQAKGIILKADKLADVNDTNYIFLFFVIHHLPVGLVGLLLAVIFLSAWGSIAAALNALASSSIIDIYQRFAKIEKTENHYFVVSKWITLAWGIFAIAVAMFAGKLGSLIEAVNILGSLFYGTILGIFLVAFYFKKLGAGSTFYAAIVVEALVIGIFTMDIISFLWLNVIGCLGVVLISFLFEMCFKVYRIKKTLKP